MISHSCWDSNHQSLVTEEGNRVEIRIKSFVVIMIHELHFCVKAGNFTSDLHGRSENTLLFIKLFDLFYSVGMNILSQMFIYLYSRIKWIVGEERHDFHNTLRDRGSIVWQREWFLQLCIIFNLQTDKVYRKECIYITNIQDILPPDRNVTSTLSAQ